MLAMLLLVDVRGVLRGVLDGQGASLRIRAASQHICRHYWDVWVR